MVCLLAVLAAACSPVQESSSPDGQSASIKGTPATVTYVVDGDTLDVKFKNGKTERVRMLLVDTPETKHPRLGVQPFGPESSKFTKTQLTGKKWALSWIFPNVTSMEDCLLTYGLANKTLTSCF